MSKFTEEMVDDYAAKLLIGLTREENAMVLAEMDAIDKSIDKINQIKDIAKVVPMTHALDDFSYELRPDVCGEVLDIDEALRNAGVVEGREIEVPKVVD